MMPNYRLLTYFSAAACAFCVAQSARAESTASDKASAEALFNEGVTLVAAGNYQDGCARFEASQALEATLGTKLHLADCYERAGKTASAWALFRESEGSARRQNETERSEVAHVRAAALEKRLSYLELDMAGEAPAQFALTRNGEAVPLSSLGAKVPVDPGPQRLSASAPSRSTWSKTVEVPSGPGTVTVSIPRLSVITPKYLSPRVVTNGSAQRGVGIGVTTVGFVGILAGVGLGLYAKHENDQSKLDRYCPTDGHDGCTQAGADLRLRAEHFASASTVTIAASSALFAGGILLWTTAPSEREHAGRALQLHASASTDSFQTALGGTW